MSVGLPGYPAKLKQPQQQQQQQHHQQQYCYDPLPWNTYYDRQDFVDLDNGHEGRKFCYYTRGDRDADTDKPLIFLLHGGGFSGLSWAAMCHALTGKAACRCVAMDARGHGDTTVAGGGDNSHDDFSLDTLADDAAAVIGRLLQAPPGCSRDESPPPALVLIGHSMGGAVATHLAHSGRLGCPIAGLVVIDVVEGSAMEALSSMRGYLASRPAKFASLPAAIRWCHRSGTVRNLDSARVSFPGHLRLVEPQTSTAAAAAAAAPAPATKSSRSGGAIQEEDEEGGDGEEETTDEAGGGDEAAAGRAATQHQPPRQQPRIAVRGPALLNARASKPPLPAPLATFCPPPQPPPPFASAPVDPKQPHYTWRIDLGATEPHWAGWFAGMSRKFLDTPAAKLLLLAGVDRLDKDLTVGQMQGKFQMQVLPRSGHAVHEDHPEHVAEVLASFLVRHKLAKPLADFHPIPPGC